ncbi:signal peptidase I [Paenibacillus sp. LMG 31460]|uniref:Signal peptidase I n=2 Tax=Paenibacillus germinis TaxID=2654979 RepID=A0ABX1YYQ0_9BACL|nr:signal peptidase I [Paenibacillus germinis]
MVLYGWLIKRAYLLRRASELMVIRVFNVATACCLLLISFTACNEERIVDSKTTLILPEVEVKQGMETITYQLDGMDETYNTKLGGKLVLSELNEPPKRGDVVYYKTPSLNMEHVFPNANPGWKPQIYDIARIVALPEESIMIRDGQVYIDEKKLDTFYGKALMWGQGEESYFNNLNKPGSGVCDSDCQKSMTKYFHMDMPEIKIPAGHVFLLGDTWARSVDSQTYGSIAIDQIEWVIIGRERKP